MSEISNKHGEIVQEGIIDISFDIVNDELIYKVENTLRAGVNSQPEKGGIGLANMRKRLDILFKDRYTLTTAPEGGVYKSVLKIKL